MGFSKRRTFWKSYYWQTSAGGLEKSSDGVHPGSGGNRPSSHTINPIGGLILGSATLRYQGEATQLAVREILTELCRWSVYPMKSKDRGPPYMIDRNFSYPMIRTWCLLRVGQVSYTARASAITRSYELRKSLICDLSLSPVRMLTRSLPNLCGTRERLHRSAGIEVTICKTRTSSSTSNKTTRQTCVDERRSNDLRLSGKLGIR